MNKNDNILFMWILFVILTAIAGYGYFYLILNYNDVSPYELLYYLRMPLKGANASPFTDELPRIAITVLSSSVIFALFHKSLTYLGISYKDASGIIILCTLICIAIILILLITHFRIISFIFTILSKTNIYEANYISPEDVTLTFPKHKRNLIYIFLESMESGYALSSLGGASKENILPNLSYLAKGNNSFASDINHINGAYVTQGATFTTGAMVAHTSGVPINLASTSDSKSSKKPDYRFISKLVTLGDILSKEGYNQELMIGSDAAFGARDSFFRAHGNYRLFDYKYAKEAGLIPSNYYEWWGFEDSKLFDFAKSELNRLSKEDKPFNLSLLTVDTHFLHGYKCHKCGDDFKEQYSNVIACSDKQVSDFINWIKEQDFYDNTTIVIAGDHTTMDSGFIRRHLDKSAPRKSFVCYLNAPENLKRISHEYTTLDLFPTTLASLGVTIPGDRLGLGVNLFSDKKTLLERLGIKKLNQELIKTSEYYKNNFV